MKSACRRCGRPGGLHHPDDRSSPDGSNCPKLEVDSCIHCKKETFHFDQVVARWTYQGMVCDAIIAAKYASKAALGHALGRQLGERVVDQVADDPPTTVTYVPSNFRRQWSRGGRSGNLAICEAVAQCCQKGLQQAVGSATVSSSATGFAVKPLLSTTRSIKKQAWLSDTERRENVCGAFAVKKGYAWPKNYRILSPREQSVPAIKHQHVLVVDDVLTTGATANEVARVLLEAGARRVTLAVVARAVWSQ